MAIGTGTLWRAKRQAEESLAQVTEARNREKEAHNREFIAFMKSFGVNDMVAVPLLREATAARIWDKTRLEQSYNLMIRYYDEIARTLESGRQRGEVVAQAARRAGALRLAVGDRRGLEDLDRAIRQYEAISAGSPANIWYRTDLISTLREYAGHLEKIGDHRADSARRRACEIAEGLLADEGTRANCFRMEIIPQFKALAEMLATLPGATPDDRQLADRLNDWIKENPEPTGGTIYLPRP